jgi:hypothetical protein
MPALKPRENPRKVFKQRHRERGPSRLFTFDDLAVAAVEAPSTTRSKLRTTTDARTAALYITEALTRRSQRLTDEEAVHALAGTATLKEWRARWPRFDLYRCGFPSCVATMLEPGLCTPHGGSFQPFAKIEGDHFVLWTGREYTPICRVIFGVIGSGAVEHVDQNAWNNHPDNLAVPADVHVRSARRNRWSYGYRELADLFDLSEDGTRQAASRGLFTPSSLDSVTSFWWLRQDRQRR